MNASALPSAQNSGYLGLQGQACSARHPNGFVFKFAIHFEDYDGKQFERLVFAYHLRNDQWRQLEWYGQVGSDLGRDIWGVKQDGSTVCLHCANRTRVEYKKGTQAIDKVLTGRHSKPDVFRFVCACNVYQRFYRLWREFKNGLCFTALRDKAEARLRDWFDDNCLYLDTRIRQEVRSCLNEVERFPGWQDRNENEAAEYQQRVIRISKNIERAVDLLK